MKSEHNSNQEGDYQADQNLHHHLNRQELSQTPSYRHLHFDVDLVLKLILLRAPILRLLASVNNLLQFFTDQKLCISWSEWYRISLHYSLCTYDYTCVAAWHGRWGRDVGTLADLRSHPQAPTEHNFSPMIIFLLKLSVVINNRWSIGHDTRENHCCDGSDL